MTGRLKDLLIFYLGFVVTAVVLGNIDFEYTSRNGKPLFAPWFLRTFFSDGGTYKFSGPGYSVWEYHRMLPYEEVGLEGKELFKTGTELEPWAITDIPGIRMFLRRDGTEEIYYDGENWTEPVVISGMVNESPYFEMIFEAIEDVLPYLFFFGCFAVFRKIKTMIGNRSGPPKSGT